MSAKNPLDFVFIAADERRPDPVADAQSAYLQNLADGEDPHRKAAAAAFGVAEADVTPKQRQIAKWARYLDTYTSRSTTESLRQEIMAAQSLRRGYPWQRRVKKLRAMQRRRKAAKRSLFRVP